jgi:hypothetical protein
MPDDADAPATTEATESSPTTGTADTPAPPDALPALADERRELVELETEVAAIEAELGALDTAR